MAEKTPKGVLRENGMKRMDATGGVEWWWWCVVPKNLFPY
jgi:hypothetical protein